MPRLFNADDDITFKLQNKADKMGRYDNESDGEVSMKAAPLPSIEQDLQELNSIDSQLYALTCRRKEMIGKVREKKADIEDSIFSSEQYYQGDILGNPVDPRPGRY